MASVDLVLKFSTIIVAATCSRLVFFKNRSGLSICTAVLARVLNLVPRYYARLTYVNSCSIFFYLYLLQTDRISLFMLVSLTRDRLFGTVLSLHWLIPIAQICEDPLDTNRQPRLAKSWIWT